MATGIALYTQVALRHLAGEAPTQS
jgi:hypothetical protein